MVFTTPVFLFLFMPLFFLLYYLMPEKLRTPVLLLGSWLFYAFWRIDFLFLVILVSMANYVFGYLINVFRSNPSLCKRILQGAVISNLSVLFYFKYFNFGVESFNSLLNVMGFNSSIMSQVILPIGISFYIFQSMSYVIDVYREDARPAESFIELATYVALFPQLIAGPILRYKDIADQLKKRDHNLHLFGQGFVLFIIGVCRKVLIADAVAPLADILFATNSPTFVEAWLGAIIYGIQIYFDFSGYSDMALGLGKMMGFNFKQNFNVPYKSKSITEFWQRWHISLSRWLRDYLYIPLGGNRKSPQRTYINLLVVMLLGGLWHGAAWNFLIWGGWHGLWLMVERRFDLKGENKLHWLRTMLIVAVSWIFFRAENLSVVASMLQGMIGLNGLFISDAVNWQLSRFSLFMVLISVLLMFLEPKFNSDESLNRLRIIGLKRASLYYLLFGASVLKLLSDSYSPFLYFRF